MTSLYMNSFTRKQQILTTEETKTYKEFDILISEYNTFFKILT